MPVIRAFRGLHYNPEKVKDISAVVTEPYDVISSQQQKIYHRRHPYNIIRLILGKRLVRDSVKNNSYTRSAKLFKNWQKDKILLQDNEESIYVYSMSFVHNNKKKISTGFITLLKLEDFTENTILPHENTFSKPVCDRLKILKTVGANLSPIFAVFSDQQKKVNKILNQCKKERKPYFSIQHNGVHHRIWQVTNKIKIATIKKLIQTHQAFIADGHHRYEAALKYKNQMQKKAPIKGAFSDYVMTYLVAATDPGLTILPTHRVVRVKNFSDANKFIQNLKSFFKLIRFSTSERLFSYLDKAKAEHLLGVYLGRDSFYGLKLKNNKQARQVLAENNHDKFKNLDVVLLHKLVIENLLEVSSPDKNIYYTADAQGAIKLVDQRKYQVVFFLRPATVKEVQRTAASGERMPHKSTYFYPKLLTGLVINKLS